MLRRIDLALHLARIGLAAATLALGERLHSAPLMVGASALLFLGSFALMHDLAHGALGLPRRWNEAALSIAGALLGMSGHAIRRTHLRHHARTLAADDLEGRPARGGLLRAIATGPRAAIALRVAAMRSAGARGRRLQIAETAVNAISLAAMIASGVSALRIYAIVAILAQATMSAWASQIPHNAPPWLSRLAARLAVLGSPTLLSLAYHDLHHARPEVPCRGLSSVGRGPGGLILPR